MAFQQFKRNYTINGINQQGIHSLFQLNEATYKVYSVKVSNHYHLSLDEI
jgi:hypothetical protein